MPGPSNWVTINTRLKRGTLAELKRLAALQDKYRYELMEELLAEALKDMGRRRG